MFFLWYRFKKFFGTATLDDEVSHALKLSVRALESQKKNKHKDLLKVSDVLQKIMERLSFRVRDLVLAQPPVPLLGYLWGFRHINLMRKLREEKERTQEYQFMLEYLHAVWSGYTEFPSETNTLDESKVGLLEDTLGKLQHITMMYCATSARSQIKSKNDRQWADMEFNAKSAWALIRGNRYQVLEEEFFSFVLEPHADALRTAYKMEPNEIAAEIQAITDAMRTGFSQAVQKMYEGMDQVCVLMAKTGDNFDLAVEKMKESDEDFAGEASGAIRDLSLGGTCNLSRHTNFTLPLLEDISYLPGENSEFFDPGDFSGTPMRTLPARVKPGIKLGGEYYATDGQFIRDSMYRAIQRGLLNRLPAYSEKWNRRQKTLIEKSFLTIFDRQFTGATSYSEVFYKHPKTKQWVETDLVMMVDDVLLVVEAKAGVMAMHSPATDFHKHKHVIHRLIIEAYEQCKRFTEYLSSAPQVSLYARNNGEYVEIEHLQQSDYRVILPIGLTVEAYTPLSSMSKSLAVIQPLLGKHPFISMSVDDLFVLNRFLPTTGELLHYLEVRQKTAGIPNAILLDEADHLGAYITDNRLDLRSQNHIERIGVAIWNSASDVVDKYFEGETWKTTSPPRQEYPEELMIVFNALDKFRPPRWLEMDSHIRNLDDSARNNLAECLAKLKITLREYPARRVLIGGDFFLQVWICRSGAEPSSQRMRYEGEVCCFIVDASRVLVLRLSHNKKGKVTGLACTSYSKPPATQTNYTDLIRRAEYERSRLIRLNG